MSTPIHLPAKAVKAAACFMSLDESRYVLNGIHLCRMNGQNLVVATDGRQMLILNAGQFDWPEGLLLTFRPDQVLTMMEKHGLPDDVLTIQLLDEKYILVQANIYPDSVWHWEIKAERTDYVGTYPEWWKVLPPECPEEHRQRLWLALDAGRVLKIADAFRAWTGREPLLTLHQPEVVNHVTGVIVVTTGRDDIMALLMPCRVTGAVETEVRVCDFVRKAEAILRTEKEVSKS